MEKVKAFNIDRLLLCCNEAEIDVSEIHKTFGFAESTTQKLLSGEDVLSFSQLKKIANYFDRGILFFLGEERIDEKKTSTPQYRTVRDQRPHLPFRIKKLIRRVERQRDIYLSLMDELGEDDINPVVYPKFSSANNEGRAEVIRQWLGLGDCNKFDDYRRAIENKGIFVLVSNGYNGKWQIDKNSPIRGFSLYHEIMPIIFVKKASTKEAQSFTLIHELIHLVIHKDSFIDDVDTLISRKGKEREANDIAGNLLVPKRFIEMVNLSKFPADEVWHYAEFFREYCNNWGISTEVILLRLIGNHRLDYEVYIKYKEWVAKTDIQQKSKIPVSIPRMYRYREPANIFGKSYVGMVLNALNADYITLPKASSYLDNIKVRHIRALESDYARL